MHENSIFSIKIHTVAWKNNEYSAINGVLNNNNNEKFDTNIQPDYLEGKTRNARFIFYSTF